LCLKDGEAPRDQRERGGCQVGETVSVLARTPRGLPAAAAAALVVLDPGGRTLEAPVVERLASDLTTLVGPVLAGPGVHRGFILWLDGAMDERTLGERLAGQPSGSLNLPGLLGQQAFEVKVK
jgi:hypothetical protein